MRNLYFLLLGYRVLIIPIHKWKYASNNGKTKDYLRNQINKLNKNDDIIYLE